MLHPSNLRQPDLDSELSIIEAHYLGRGHYPKNTGSFREFPGEASGTCAGTLYLCIHQHISHATDLTTPQPIRADLSTISKGKPLAAPTASFSV